MPPANTSPRWPHIAPLLRQHVAILLVLIAFVALGVIYSISTPLLEGPDEMWHYPYVKHIADGKGLPQQSPQGVKSEFHQPPLYYALGALVTFPLNTNDLPQLMEPNPYWGYRARAPEADNKNIFLHTGRDRRPIWGAALAIYVVRWMSVLLAAITVLGTYLIALELFPAQRGFAASAAALVAFTPQHLYLAGTVNNDNLITPLSTLVVWLGIRLVAAPKYPDQVAPTRDSSRWQLAAVGALMGLSLLTKWTALLLLPLIGLVLLYRFLQHRSWPQLLRQSLLVFGIALAISGWFFVRNQLLYQDPLGIGRKMEIFPPRSPRPGLMDLIREIPRKELSFWASFGWENVYADPWIYPLLRGFMYIGTISVLIYTWKKRRTFLSDRQWPKLAVLTLWIGAVGAGFVRWMIYTEAAVGRHLFPAISSLMILWLLGWTWFLKGQARRVVMIGLAALMFLFAAATPWRYIQPTYALPPRYPSDNLPAIPQQLDVNYNEQVRLLGYDLEPNPAQPGQMVTVTLYWQILDRLPLNYSVFIHVLDESGQIFAQRDSYPGLGSYPTTMWQPGEVIEDSYLVLMPESELDRPRELRVTAGFYLLSNMQRLPIVNQAEQVGNAALLGPLQLAPRE